MVGTLRQNFLAQNADVRVQPAHNHYEFPATATHLIRHKPQPETVTFYRLRKIASCKNRASRRFENLQPERGRRVDRKIRPDDAPCRRNTWRVIYESWPFLAPAFSRRADCPLVAARAEAILPARSARALLHLRLRRPSPPAVLIRLKYSVRPSSYGKVIQITQPAVQNFLQRGLRSGRCLPCKVW